MYWQIRAFGTPRSKEDDMQMISANCPACGGSYGGRFTSRFVTCEYCGSRFALTQEELEAIGFVDSDGDGYDDNDVAPKKDRRANKRDADDGTPMYAYARDECEKFLKRADESDFEETNKVKNGLDIKHGDDIYLIHDDTLFGSGKNGFAITREGIYCREFGDRSSHFVSWDEFAEGGEPELDDSYIRQDGTSLCYFSGDSDMRDNKLFPLFQDLYDHALRVM